VVVAVAFFAVFCAMVEVEAGFFRYPMLSKEPTSSWWDADLQDSKRLERIVEASVPRSRMTGPPVGRVSGGVSCHGLKVKAVVFTG